MHKDFTYCRADISDEDGNFLVNVKIWEHDIKEGYIEVQPSPALIGEMWCTIVVRTSPAPCTFQGRIRKSRGRTIITIVKENILEGRKSHRYKINMMVEVEGLVYDDKVYPLHTNIEAQVEDISRGGMRLRTSSGAFNFGDKVLIRLETDKGPPNGFLLFAEIVSHVDVLKEYSSYGCRFITDSNIKSIPKNIGYELPI